MFLVLISFFLHLVQPPTGSLEVVVQNVDIASDETVRVGLYNNPDVFPDESKQYQGKILPASRTSLTFRFDGLSPGKYALASFQDENNDGVLNTNFLGAPTEEYGFSQNPRIWSSASSTVILRLLCGSGLALLNRSDTKLVISLARSRSCCPACSAPRSMRSSSR